MTIRIYRTLCYVGSALILVSFAWPLSIKLLHNANLLQGWDGFGLFVIGLRLLPWTAGLGVLLLAAGIIARIKDRAFKRNLWPSVFFYSLLVLALFLLFRYAGSGNLDHAVVVGSYAIKGAGASELLTLDINGSYAQRLVLNNGAETTTSGIWALEPFGGEPKIILHPNDQNSPIMVLGIERP